MLKLTFIATIILAALVSIAPRSEARYQPFPRGQVLTESERPESKTERYLERLFSPENLPNMGLCLVGVFGILYARKTLKKIDEQTEATKKSADAARDNIELLINKERARIQVDPGAIRIEDSTDQFEPPTREMKYRVTCGGTTQATILDGRVWAEISVSTKPLYPESYAPMIGLPRVLAPTETGVELIQYLNGDETFFSVLLDEGLDDGKLFLNFWGRIKYQDIFSDEYVWVYTFSYMWFAQGDGQGHWIPSEQESDNSETREKLPPR
jgi:hypothetical protein